MFRSTSCSEALFYNLDRILLRKLLLKLAGAPNANTSRQSHSSFHLVIERVTEGARWLAGAGTTETGSPVTNVVLRVQNTDMIGAVVSRFLSAS